MQLVKQKKGMATPRHDDGKLTVDANVQVVESADTEKWNQYLAGRSSGDLFHRAEWDQVFAVYRLPRVRLAAVRDGHIVGVLPLVWQRSILFGSHFVSLPWFDAAGVLADDVGVRDALLRRAWQVTETGRAKSLQVRLAVSLDPAPQPTPQRTGGTAEESEESPLHDSRPCPKQPVAAALRVRTDKVLMRLGLESNPDVLWKRLKTKVRNQVRKASKCDLTVERGGDALIREFYQVYSQNMRDLGSPSHHASLFQAVWEAFPDRTAIYVVRLDGKAIGAGWTMANGEVLEIPWASSLQQFNRYCVNHLMYWEILKHACDGGFRWFHFGRSSRNSGTYRFKKQWGADEVPLYWYYWSTGDGLTGDGLTGDGLTGDGLTGDGTGRRGNDVRTPQDSFGWAAEVWRRLPLWLTRRLGPRIIAKVP